MLSENDQAFRWLAAAGLQDGNRTGLVYALRRMAIPFGGNLPVVGALARKIVAATLLRRLEAGRYTDTVWKWSGGHMFYAQPNEVPSLATKGSVKRSPR